MKSGGRFTFNEVDVHSLVGFGSNYSTTDYAA